MKITSLILATVATLPAVAVWCAEPLAPMLDLPGSGTDPSRIDYATLPVVSGQHALVTQGIAPMIFRLHSYLAFHDGRYWCMWSQGPAIEDKPTQGVGYSTSADGLSWATAGEITGPAPEPGFRFIARGFWERDGKFLALAGHDEALDAQGKSHYFGPHLQLMAFAWQSGNRRWQPLGAIADKAINNFPPIRLPGGDWAMICRGPDYRHDVFLLHGGVQSLDHWNRVPITIKTTANSFRPEEPDWWILPDNRTLVGVFRDNARSGRLFRAVSKDDGHSWTTPTRTNFPNVTSKFFCRRMSGGYYVLVSNPSPAGRNPLCVSTSEDGVTFTHMARLPIPEKAMGGKFDEHGTSGTVQYPHAIESGGALLVTYSRNKTAIEVIQVPLEQLDLLRAGKLR